MAWFCYCSLIFVSLFVLCSSFFSIPFPAPFFSVWDVLGSFWLIHDEQGYVLIEFSQVIWTFSARAQRSIHLFLFLWETPFLPQILPFLEFGSISGNDFWGLDSFPGKFDLCQVWNRFMEIWEVFVQFLGAIFFCFLFTVLRQVLAVFSRGHPWATSASFLVVCISWPSSFLLQLVYFSRRVPVFFCISLLLFCSFLCSLIWLQSVSCFWSPCEYTPRARAPAVLSAESSEHPARSILGHTL